MTETPTRTPYFCPLIKEKCRPDCALVKDGECAIYLIAYEISLTRGYT